MDSPQKRCVIADDVRAFREILKKWMEELGFECTTARNGIEAKKALKEVIPDLVITDIDMPRASGLKLLQSVRAEDENAIAEIPVIVISSLDDSEMHSLIEKMGGTGFVGKPLSKEQLHWAVRKIEEGCRNLNEISIHQSDTPKTKTVSPTLRRLLRKASESNEYET